MAGESFPASWFNQTAGIPMPDSAGTSRFVDSINGSDATGNGNIATPYRTIAKAQDNVVAGDILELRSHQGQEYSPIPGERTLNGIKFTENIGITGDYTFVQFVSGGSLVVTVSGHLIQIQYISGTTTRQQATDAVNASAANTFLVASTTTGATVLTGVDITMNNGAIFGPASLNKGSNQAQTVSCNSIWASGTNGVTPPGTCNPITIRTYPADRSSFGRAVVKARPGASKCPGKNMAAADVGKTAAQILSQATITLISGGGATFPNSGQISVPGLSTSLFYTSRSGDILQGVYAGGQSPTGTTSNGTTGVTMTPGSAYDCNAIMTQGNSSLKLNGLKIAGSAGRNGVGFYASGSSTYVDISDCELKGPDNWYQNTFHDTTVQHIYYRRNWHHDVGTGARSLPSNNLQTPFAQQHDMYIDGDDVWVINCVIADALYGFGGQVYPGPNDVLNFVHCTVVHCGHGGSASDALGPFVLDGVTNSKIINCVVADPAYFCVANVGGLSTGDTVKNSLLAMNQATDSTHNYFGKNGVSDSSWVTDTANSKTTGMPSFVDYANRSTNPLKLAFASNPGVTVDTTFSPNYDFSGTTRTTFTVGAFEFVAGAQVQGSISGPSYSRSASSGSVANAGHMGQFKPVDIRKVHRRGRR